MVGVVVCMLAQYDPRCTRRCTVGHGVLTSDLSLFLLQIGLALQEYPCNIAIYHLRYSHAQMFGLGVDYGSL